ncbi:MAG: hypothetical protein JSU70_00730 [Phycisphaerales bacterium]|nr:MAG: hypothetical protein JSU70_00730 [Phycisphaerales bacterium]
MDDFSSSGFSNGDLDEPIPIDDDLDKPIPLGGDPPGQGSVSRSPLSLGGGSQPQPKPQPQPRKIQVPTPAAKKPAENVTSADRITGVRTFFTKLHPGALNFLDEQINDWLKNNPGIQVKRTDLTTGEVQAKKTEPNIIITVWY